MRGRDILVGCGLGCLGVVILAIAGCVGFRIWLETPAEVLETERLFADDTVGYVELRLSLDDPSTVRFVDEVLHRSRPLDTSELPSLVRMWIEMANRRRARQVRELLPAVVSWTLTPGRSPGEDHHLVSLSAEGIGNRLTLAGWFLGLVLRQSGDVRVEEYQGVRLLRLPREGDREAALVLRRGDLHYASSREAAERAVDRLLGGEEGGPGPPTELERWFAALPAERPLRGAIDNRRGELGRLVRQLELEPGVEERALLDEVRGFTLSGDFIEGPGFEGALEIHGASPEWARAHADALAELVEREESRGGLRTTAVPEVIGSRVRVGFVLAEISLPEAERRRAVEAEPGTEEGDG